MLWEFTQNGASRTALSCALGGSVLAGGGRRPVDLSLSAVIAFCVVTQLVAVPIFIWVGQHSRPS